MTMYGQCTNCGSIEVRLFEQDGVQDLSKMGESSEYPFGAGCEVCQLHSSNWRSATAPDEWRRGTTYAKSLNLE